MGTNLRPSAFVMTSTNHGSMLVNRFDYRIVEDGGYGMGYQLLNTSAFDSEEIGVILDLVASLREDRGDGVVAVDCGANVGVHTIEMAKAMHGWGEVIAFEAQERIYYALAGNITLNNCFNAKAIYAAVGAKNGEISVPQPDYFSPSSFGSLEIRKTEKTEYIGQDIDYSDDKCVKVKMMAIDDLNLKRLDFLKIDIEGMEIEALLGAEKTITKFKPQLVIEKIKSNDEEIQKFLKKHEYKVFPFLLNYLAIHKDDKGLERIELMNE